MFITKVKHLLWNKKSLLFAWHIYLLFLGFYSYAIYEPINECEMTFMFQFPEFISIPLKSNVTKKYPNYSLFVYGEGSYANSWQYPKMTNSLSGIPVLFVPGNGGSYKQVRSFGSVALRMADDIVTPFNFDFFTINFNEELSGLNGDLLTGQTEFLYECIEAIKKLYLKAGRRVSLIVIGHSVGGLISRAVFTDTNFDASSVDLLITLATPHQRPVLPIDLSSTTFYKKVNEQWNRIRNLPQMSHLTVVSINGGFSDKLVRAELTQLPSPIVENGDVSLGTSMIPDVWVSTDHLCIVWCRQLIIKLMRLLYDLIPKESNFVTPDMDLRKKVIQYHLFTRTRSKTYPLFLVPEKTVIPTVGDNIYQNYRFLTFHKQKVITATSIMIPLIPKTTIVISASGIQKLDWAIACKSVVNTVNDTETHTCDHGINLSQSSKVIPGNYDTERRFFKKEASHLLNRGFDHLLLYVGPTTNKVTINSERFQSGRRNKAIILPSLFQSLTSLIFSSVTVLTVPITEESTFYNLTIIGVEQIWHSYWLKLEVTSCYPTASEISYIHFSVPWSNEDTFTTVRSKKRQFAETVIKVNMPKPISEVNRHPYINLILDPYCGYELHVKLSLREVLGQIFRHYYHKLLPWINAILLSIIAIQMKQREERASIIAQNSQSASNELQRKIFLSIPLILKQHFLSVSMYGILPFTSLLIAHVIQRIDGNHTFTHYLSYFIESHLTFSQQLLLQFFLFTTAYSIIFLISTIVTLTMYAINELILFISKKLFGDLRKERNDSAKKSQINRMKKLPIIVSLLLCAVSVVSCSAIGLLAAILSHFIQLLLYSYKSTKLERRIGYTSETTHYNTHLSVLFLLLTSFIPSIPYGFIWLRNHLHNEFNSYPPVIDFQIPLLILLLNGFWQQSTCVPSNQFAVKFLTFIFSLLSIIVSIVGNYNYVFLSIVNAVAFSFYNICHVLCSFSRNKAHKMD